MKTSIVLKNLKFEMSIGIYGHERNALQPVVINGEVFLKSKKSYKTATIDDTLNYEALVNGIKDIAQSRHYDLIETLTEEICDFCLALPDVKKVHIYAEKTQPFDEMDSIGVRMKKEKER